MKILADDKHSHAVTVCVTPTGIWTGSQNGNINIWRLDGNFQSTFRAHDDIVRQMVVIPNIGVLSSSNDYTLKLWGFDGQLM
jgi:phospholipase A-2-activating protein